MNTNVINSENISLIMINLGPINFIDVYVCKKLNIQNNKSKLRIIRAVLKHDGHSGINRKIMPIVNNKIATAYTPFHKLNRKNLHFVRNIFESIT